MPEIDLTALDASGSSLPFVGTVTWRQDRPVTVDEVATLGAAATAVPGAQVGTPLVAVCPAGGEREAPPAATWTARDLPPAWP